MWRYIAFGLHVCSDLELPELPSGGERDDVVIRLTKVTSVPLQPFSGGRHSLYLTGKSTYLLWEKIGLFAVHDGREIEVDTDQDVPHDTLRLFILGPIFGVLLNQRGTIVLHGSAVAIHQKAVAFLGWKGHGKSTTAAALSKRGHPLITDDLLIVEADPAHKPWVVPAFPQVKIWPDAAGALDENPALLRRLQPQGEKRAFFPATGFPSASLPVTQIYLLEFGPVLEVQPLIGSAALVALLHHFYPGRFVGNTALTSLHFSKLAFIVKNVRVARLQRVKDLSTLSSVSALIESDVARENSVD